MKPYPFSTPLSSSRTYVLDDPEKALEEFTELYQDAIVLVIYNETSITESKLKAANRYTRPIGATLGTNELAKKVLLIEDAEVLKKVEEKIKALLPAADRFEEVAAFSIVITRGKEKDKDKEKVAHTILKEEWSSPNLRKAFNLAIIALDDSTPS